MYKVYLKGFLSLFFKILPVALIECITMSLSIHNGESLYHTCTKLYLKGFSLVILQNFRRWHLLKVPFIISLSIPNCLHVLHVISIP